MKLKTISMLALAVLALAVLAGCAQDSTNTSDDNPQMQESVMKGEGAAKAKATAEGATQSEGTNPTRSEAKGGAGSGNNKLALAADPTGQLKYDPTKLNANVGNIAIVLTNDSAVPHDVAVKGSDGKSLGTSKEITKSETTLALKNVKAGSYTFFCTVPGHEQAGMKGTLSVR